MQALTVPQELRDLPASRPGSRRSYEDLVDDLIGSDRILQAAEAATVSAFAMWAIFPGINVDDDLLRAYEAAYPGLALDSSLYKHYLNLAESGEASLTGLISGLKGKLAEFHAMDMLQQNGYTNVEIAQSPTQTVWDISAVNPSGESVAFQVKTGAESYADDVTAALDAEPDVHFIVSTEIYNEITDNSPEYLAPLTATGYDYVLVENIEDGLSVLSGNQGIDIPDGVGEILPIAGGILLASRLIHSAWNTERGFMEADRTTRNKVHVVRTLTLMSRFAVSSGAATVLGIGGATAGSPLPGPGNIVGGIAGVLIGAGLGAYLNNLSQPRMLDLALDITGLTYDDLFYYKNKAHIDEVAVRFHETTRRLTATDWLAAP
ncbi:MAG: hypothetical protein OXG64_04485 [Chloroflexi bacterium]|nr:hypothetical protein [Chloroflexota bacterium]